LKKHSDIYPWYFYFAKNNAGQRIIGIHRKGFKDSHVDEGRDNRVEPAFIMRITVFICAGIGSIATFGSARYTLHGLALVKVKVLHTKLVSFLPPLGVTPISFFTLLSCAENPAMSSGFFQFLIFR
jgi:hypothetical protein